MTFLNILEFGAAAKGIDYVLRPGGYLIVQNSREEVAVIATPKGYYLPGGGQNDGETPVETAVRETLEECGLHVQITGLIGMADELVFSDAENIHYRKRCTFFTAKFISQKGIGEEDHQLIWMTAEETLLRLSHKSQIWAVSKTLESIS